MTLTETLALAENPEETPVKRLLLAVLLCLVCASSAQAANRWGSYVGTEKMQIYAPTLVEGIGGAVTGVEASNASSYFLRSDGRVFAEGNGKQGQLGNGGQANSTTAVEVSLPAGTVIVSLGEAKDEASRSIPLVRVGLGERTVLARCASAKSPSSSCLSGCPA